MVHVVYRRSEPGRVVTTPQRRPTRLSRLVSFVLKKGSGAAVENVASVMVAPATLATRIAAAFTAGFLITMVSVLPFGAWLLGKADLSLAAAGSAVVVALLVTGGTGSGAGAAIVAAGWGWLLGEIVEAASAQGAADLLEGRLPDAGLVWLLSTIAGLVSGGLAALLLDKLTGTRPRLRAALGALLLVAAGVLVGWWLGAAYTARGREVVSLVITRAVVLLEWAATLPTTAGSAIASILAAWRYLLAWGAGLGAAVAASYLLGYRRPRVLVDHLPLDWRLLEEIRCYGRFFLSLGFGGWITVVLVASIVAELFLNVLTNGPKAATGPFAQFLVDVFTRLRTLVN
jgi:hypothetical protein